MSESKETSNNPAMDNDKANNNANILDSDSPETLQQSSLSNIATDQMMEDTHSLQSSPVLQTVDVDTALQSPSVLSDSSLNKPDPPSVIDNSVLEEEDQEDAANTSSNDKKVPRGTQDAEETGSKDGGALLFSVERESKETDTVDNLLSSNKPALYINVHNDNGEEDDSRLPEDSLDGRGHDLSMGGPGSDDSQHDDGKDIQDNDIQEGDLNDHAPTPISNPPSTDRPSADESPDDKIEQHGTLPEVHPVANSSKDEPIPQIYDAPKSITSHDSLGTGQQQQHQTHDDALVGRAFPDTSERLQIGRSYGPDEVVLLPRVDEHLVRQQQQQREQDMATVSSHSHTQPFMSPNLPPTHAMVPIQQQSFGYTLTGARRKIRFRLQEDVLSKRKRMPGGILGHIRSRSSRMMFGENGIEALDNMNFKSVDRGNITVSWFEGTSSNELQEHVRKSVERKLRLEKNIELADIRILDESVEPPEEIVLSPFIPDGSQFLLRFTTTDTNDGTASPMSTYSGRAPDSPSAAPSPHPSGHRLAQWNSKQLASLQKQLDELTKSGAQQSSREKSELKYRRRSKSDKDLNDEKNRKQEGNDEKENKDDSKEDDGSKEHLSDDGSYPGVEDDMVLHSEDPVEARLRQITELLISDRQERRQGKSTRRTEKRQVIFVLANYFVLFLSLIALSAEIQARAPNWLASLESQMKNVRNCSENQEALFQCVSNGDLAGLIASVILWLSRSVATRRIFLFGFETPNKLWTVVYESLITSVCWGFSYLFIRRGMNPDTRRRFVQKYWKDAVYGSLAGFNAAFMKQVLKNLIPQEAMENALRERQLKILSFLPSFA